MTNDKIEDTPELFTEWTTLFAMVMKLQNVPIIDGNLNKTAAYIIDAYGRYLESRGIEPKDYRHNPFRSDDES